MLKNNIFIIMALLLQAFFVITIIHHIYIVDDLISLKGLLPYFNLVIVLLTFSLVFAIKKLQKDVEKITEVNLLKTHLGQVEDLLKTFHAQKHEHTRHIQTLQAMLYLDEVEDAKNYIEGITDYYWNLNEIVSVGHPALTALLNSKKEVAISKGIDFAFTVKCNLANLPLEPWDLCSMVGNLIDNALEAVLQSGEPKRVTLEIKCEEENYLIYVYNTGAKLSDKDMDKIFEPGFTTKNSAARGYGLFIVKKLADKYGGKIQVISKEKTVFIVNIPAKGRM